MALLELMSSLSLGRWIFTPRGVKKGYLRIADAEVEEVCLGDAPVDSLKALVLPALVNAHSHIGDSVAYPAPKGTVLDLVGPPHGHKHKMLRAKSKYEKIAAMREAIGIMKSSGTTLFADFREEGLEGVMALRSALDIDSPSALVFGRPASDEPTDSEVASLLSGCEGIGVSALSDWPLDLLQKLSKGAKRAGKLFAMHASETKREDIDLILDLKPDFLVHMCGATDGDIELCADSGVPIVVCPRSNRFFDLDPNIPRLLRSGITVALGTDNGMIVQPDMLEELKAAYTACGARPCVSSFDFVSLATFSGRKVLNAKAKITTEITEKMDLVVLRVTDDDPLRELITKSVSKDILAVIRGGKVGRTHTWTR